MATLNWGKIQDGGAFESLMHAILYADDPGIILFGRPGKDAGQDARSEDGTVVYQAKYRRQMTMDVAVGLAKEELIIIKKYRQSDHQNNIHWKDTKRWVLVSNFSTNPNDVEKWKDNVVPLFQSEGIIAEYWDIPELENKLIAHPHIRDVFFDGENRVLIGLKEAHDLLRSKYMDSSSLEKPMIGHETEMQAISTFVDSAEKRLLPIVGIGGIGKSRLLYESLVSLSLKGWRVFWALPGTMARSSRWFHLLNSNKPTCVVIDDPDDPGLLRAIVEQLAPIERQNWKVIVACRSEKSEILRPFKNNPQVADPIRLGPLNEVDSKDLLKSILKTQQTEDWLHSVYNYVHGVPGWLYLIAELSNRELLSDLPNNTDEIASAYVDSCLSSLSETQRDLGKITLQWLSLLGFLLLEDISEEQLELRFLKNLGVPEATVRELLDHFVSTGLVRNWGIKKRMYAVEPLILREYILSDWLLQRNDGDKYSISKEGRKIAEDLAKNKLPAVDRILGTLSHLTLSSLTRQRDSLSSNLFSIPW